MSLDKVRADTTVHRIVNEGVYECPYCHEEGDHGVIELHMRYRYEAGELGATTLVRVYFCRVCLCEWETVRTYNALGTTLSLREVQRRIR